MQRIAHTSWAALLLAALTACTPRLADLSAPVQTPASFTVSPSDTVNAQMRSARWWSAFGDSTVDALVDTALNANFDLESAWHRLRGARAVVSREFAALVPELDAFLEADVERSDAGDRESFRAGLAASYEIDLWGRIRSGVQAERYRARATQADYRTAALSLSAEVVRTWYQLVEAQSQVDLIDEQIQTNVKALSLIRARFGSGQIRSVDILRQRQLLESTREQKIAAESRVRVLEHQLAVLLGRVPQNGLSLPSRTLPGLPHLPEAGLPADLIRRRPDVQQAYSLLAAADRDLAVAVTNRFPRLTLSASVSSTSSEPRDLFQNWARNLTAGLLAPIFNAGELGAEVKRSEAVRDERLAAYGQTILTAFQEVENALIQERKQVERIASLELQLQLVRQTYGQSRIEYLNGQSDYLNVLSALTDEQRIRRDLLTARLLLLEYRIALYRALAGGFETDRESNA